MYDMVDHYNINVALNGQHVFSANIRDRAPAYFAYCQLCKKFKQENGWKITVTRWQGIGKDVTSDFMEKMQ